MAKILVAYFSATGTTGIAATALAEAAGAELMEGVMLNGEKNKEELREITEHYIWSM